MKYVKLFAKYSCKGFAVLFDCLASFFTCVSKMFNYCYDKLNSEPVEPVQEVK